MLTNPQILNAKPRERPYRLSDALGLYMEVTPSGGRYWRLKYRFAGKEKHLALGTYPEVSLRDARGKRDDARRALREGSDPGEDRKASKAAQRGSAISTSRTFEVVARDWFAKRSAKWAATNSGRLMARLERDLFPRLGSRPIADPRKQKTRFAAGSLVQSVGSRSLLIFRRITPITPRAEPKR